VSSGPAVGRACRHLLSRVERCVVVIDYFARSSLVLGEENPLWRLLTLGSLTPIEKSPRTVDAPSFAQGRVEVVDVHTPV
jgi:hypothetical protein